MEVFMERKKFAHKHSEDRVIKPILYMNSLRRKKYFYVFDISNRKEDIEAKTISVEFKFNEAGAVNELNCTAIA